MNKKKSFLVSYLIAFIVALSLFSISSISADEIPMTGKQLSCLRTGESLLPGDSIVLEGDGEEWDRITLVLEEHELALYLEVKGQKSHVWSIRSGFYRIENKFKSASLTSGGKFVLNGDMKIFMPDNGKLAFLNDVDIFHIKLRSTEDLYLVVEKTLNSARIAIYNSSNELLWDSENGRFVSFPLC